MIIENDDKMMMMMMKRVIFKVLCHPQKKQQKRQTKDTKCILPKNCFLRERERENTRNEKTTAAQKENISLRE